MKIKLYIIIFNYLLLHFTVAQNLVPNHSFEDTITCPYRDNLEVFCFDWSSGNHLSSLDYYNTCANNFTGILSGRGIPSNSMGYQNVIDGNGYAGLLTYQKQFSLPDSIQSWREYLTCELIDSLQENKCYKFSFIYSLAESISNVAVKEFGVFFSDSLPLNNAVPFPVHNLNYQPQIEVNQWMNDTSNWIKITRFYMAEGGEKFITLGNFKDNNNTDTLFIQPLISDGISQSYIYIDDIHLEKVPFQTFADLNLGPDTVLCKGTQIIFDNILADSTIYVWNQINNDAFFTIDSSGPYILEAYNGCSYISDTINVKFIGPEVDLGEDIIKCKREEIVLFNSLPSSQNINTEFIWSTNETTSQIQISDSGLYTLSETLENCTYTDSVNIDYETPTNSIFQTQNLDTTFCVSGILDAGSSEWNDTYTWNTGAATQTIEVTQSGDYEVYTENECTEATSHFNVKVESLEEGLNNYNIITPNNDFVNDLFTIYEGNSEQYQIQIYNRWGKLVWQSDEPTNHWDGKSGVIQSATKNLPDSEGVSVGTYFYHLSFRNCAGETVEKKGSVEVRR